MTNDSEVGRPDLNRLRLSRAERDALDERIATRVREAGFDPVRPRNPDDGAPLPKNRWIFSSVAYSRGGAYARSFKTAMKGLKTDNFRLVTLRFGPTKPASGELEVHIRKVSEAANSVIRYLVRQRLAQPQLSVIHLRFDEVSSRLDPHLQGVWEISPEQMSRVDELLRKHFSGVWIDKEPIRNLSAVAFYLCAGIVDHCRVPEWPLTAISEIWSLPGRLHFVRPAGHFAAWIKTHRAASSTKKPPERPADAPRIDGTAPPAPEVTDGHSDVLSRLPGASAATPTKSSSEGSPPEAYTSSASSAGQEISSHTSNETSLSKVRAPRFNEILALLMELAATQKTDW